MEKQYRLSLIVLLFSPVLWTATQAIQRESFVPFVPTPKITATITQALSAQGIATLNSFLETIPIFSEQTHRAPITQEKARKQLDQLIDQWHKAYPDERLPYQSDFEIDNAMEDKEALQLAYMLLYIEIKTTVDFLRKKRINDLDEKMKLLQLIITIHEDLRFVPFDVCLNYYDSFLLNPRIPKPILYYSLPRHSVVNVIVQTNLSEPIDSPHNKSILLPKIVKLAEEEHDFYGSLTTIEIDPPDLMSTLAVQKEELEALCQESLDQYGNLRELVYGTLPHALLISYQSLLYVFAKKLHIPLDPAAEQTIRKQFITRPLFSLKKWTDSIYAKTRTIEAEDEEEGVQFLAQNISASQNLNFTRNGREATLRSFRSLS